MKEKSICFTCETEYQLLISFVLSTTVYQDRRKYLLLRRNLRLEDYASRAETTKVWEKVFLVDPDMNAELFDVFSNELSSEIEVLHFFTLKFRPFNILIRKCLVNGVDLILTDGGMDTYFPKSVFTSSNDNDNLGEGTNTNVDFHKLNEIWLFKPELFSEIDHPLIKKIEISSFYDLCKRDHEFVAVFKKLFNFSNNSPLNFDIVIFRQENTLQVDESIEINKFIDQQAVALTSDYQRYVKDIIGDSLSVVTQQAEWFGLEKTPWEFLLILQRVESPNSSKCPSIYISRTASPMFTTSIFGYSGDFIFLHRVIKDYSGVEDEATSKFVENLARGYPNSRFYTPQNLSEFYEILAQSIQENHLPALNQSKEAMSANEIIWLRSFTAKLTTHENEYLKAEKRIFDLTEKLKELTKELEDLRKVNEELDNKFSDVEVELNSIKVSKSYKFSLIFRKLRLVVLPKYSKQEQIARFLWNLARGRRKLLPRKIQLDTQSLDLLDISVFSHRNVAFSAHKEKIDIIICIHNALDDVKACLNSVTRNTLPPYTLILVNDGSDAATSQFLLEYSQKNPSVRVFTNERALGYTRAANIGMRSSTAPFLVLLNSDTIVTTGWLDRMFLVMSSDKKVGLVGPLSNTASWQSIPKFSRGKDWASNPLPAGVDVNQMGANVSKYSGKVWPEVPLLNGFCLLIRKSMINQIGYFDEENFGQGYGEEDDFVIRATKNGWVAKVADDAYVFHAQSKSYTNETRRKLAAQNGERLAKKHGFENIENKVIMLSSNRVFEGIRGRTEVMFERNRLVEEGRNLFNKKTALFVLPITDAGGGGNVVINEAASMVKMGVNATIFNLSEYKLSFKQNYPSINVPQIYGSKEELLKYGESFDAIVATANYSVEWLLPLAKHGKKVFYYVQGFEPLMYSKDSPEYAKALSSYTLIDGMKCFTKTEWTRKTVFTSTGINCKNIGISVDIDLFRPLIMRAYSARPINILAMVRPGSLYRSPLLTVEVLKKAKTKFGDLINIFFFGANDISDVIDTKYLDFSFNNLGKLNQSQVASVLSNMDVFVDYSSHQAMGLTALEAMACGSSVIVPSNGGAVEFVQDHVNGIVVDTSSIDSCYSALREIIEDSFLRMNLQIRSTRSVIDYFVEKPAFSILNFLFNDGDLH